MSKPTPSSGPFTPGSAAANNANDDTDPLNPKVAASALDFLLIELVPQIQRVAEHVLAREQQQREAQTRSQAVLGNSATGAATAVGQTGGGGGKTEGAAGSNGLPAANGGSAPPPLSGETREAVCWRLDGLGYRVGQGLVERFSTNKPRPQTALDAIKFVCKDLWQLVFRKQIDNLKTNHRGVFVLTDQRFHPLSRMSVDRRAGPKAAEEAVSRAQLYLYFPAGVIRGALAGLGIEASVVAESTELPTATFQIKTKGAKA